MYLCGCEGEGQLPQGVVHPAPCLSSLEQVPVVPRHELPLQLLALRLLIHDPIVWLTLGNKRQTRVTWERHQKGQAIPMANGSHVMRYQSQE